jgi:hypothetical protein
MILLLTEIVLVYTKAFNLTSAGQHAWVFLRPQWFRKGVQVLLELHKALNASP